VSACRLLLAQLFLFPSSFFPQVSPLHTAKENTWTPEQWRCGAAGCAKGLPPPLLALFSVSAPQRSFGARSLSTTIPAKKATYVDTAARCSARISRRRPGVAASCTSGCLSRTTSGSFFLPFCRHGSGPPSPSAARYGTYAFVRPSFRGNGMGFRTARLQPSIFSARHTFRYTHDDDHDVENLSIVPVSSFLRVPGPEFTSKH